MFTEDLTAFFNTAEFAVAATWTPAAGGGPFALSVIFDNAYYESAIGDPGVAGRQPMCLAADDKLAQGSGIKRNDVLVINAVTYKVAEIEADGTGVTRLMLRT